MILDICGVKYADIQTNKHTYTTSHLYNAIILPHLVCIQRDHYEDQEVNTIILPDLHNDPIVYNLVITVYSR